MDEAVTSSANVTGDCTRYHYCFSIVCKMSNLQLANASKISVGKNRADRGDWKHCQLNFPSFVFVFFVCRLTREDKNAPLNALEKKSLFAPISLLLDKEY